MIACAARHWSCNPNCSKPKRKLTELQSKRNDQSSLMLSPEQEAELKRFVAEKARVRKELRETQRGLDVDINRLDSWLKVINIAIAPLLVAVAGVIILSLRRRRRTAAYGARHEPAAIHLAGRSPRCWRFRARCT